MELSAVSLQNKFISIEERLRAENETRNQDKMAGDSNNEMPFIRQGSGRRPGPLPLQPNGTPTRVRKTLDLIGISTQRHSNSRPSEVEARLQEIMKLTGIITIDSKKYHTKLDDLEHLGELGFGSCGHVVKMRHPTTGVVIAVKQMRRSGNREENKRITMDLEVVLKSHDCPYIVRCLGCFVTDADVWICMELMATCFDKLLKKLKQPLPEPIIGKVAVATIKALHYLKEKHGVIHRDVKPSNILLDEKGNVKLCDFGISGWLEDSMAKTRSAGCAAYMAPERIEPPDPSHPDYDIRADVWSLGITLVEMATGESPYCNCQNDFEVLARVVRDDPPLLVYSEGSPYSHELCSFVRDCLTKNYKHRPKYKKLMEHPFIKKYETYNVDVAKWYADVMKNLESSNFNRQSAQRNSQRFAPPSPSLRRVTSEPPPIPPRTPESQRKPLLARLASEPTVEGLDLQTVNGRITVVGPKPPPPAARFTPKPPNLPPRPAPTDDLKTHQRPHNPPTDLPGLPPRHPVVDNGSNGSTVARLAQKFNAKLSPSRSPKDPYEPFQIGGRSSSGESVGSATTTPLGRPVFSEPVLQRLSQIPVLSKWVKQDLKPSPQQQPQPGSLTTRRVSSDGNTARRYPPSSPQPQIPARRSSGSGLPLGSVSVPASPVLQTRHMNEVVGPGYGQQPLPRHLTPELQRRMFGQQ